MAKASARYHRAALSPNVSGRVRRAPGALAHWLWPAGCACLLAVPVVVVTMPPMVDFPAHEAVVGVLRHGNDPGYFPPSLYVPNWGHPNQLQYLLAWPLSYVLGTTKALEIVVAIAVASVILGTSALARYCHRPPWVGLLAAPVAVGWNLQWGHIANLLGLGALLLLLPTLDRFARSPRPTLSAVIIGAFALLYAAHEGAMIIAVVAVTWLSIAYGGTRAAFALRAVPCAAAAVGAALQLKLQHLTPVNSASLLPVSLSQRLELIPRTIVGYYNFDWGPRVFALVVAIVALNALRAGLPSAISNRPACSKGAVRPPWRVLILRQRWSALGVALLLAFLMLPASYGGVLFFFHRFLPVAWCVLVATTAPRTGARAERAALALCTAVPIGMLAFILPAFRASDAAYRKLDRLLPTMASASSVFSADLDRGLFKAINDDGFSTRNAQGHVVALRGGRALADYTQSPISPALVNPAYAWNGIATRTYLDPSDFCPDLVFASFRYVVLHVSLPTRGARVQQALGSDAQLVAQDSEWLIFESSVLKTRLLAVAEPTYDAMGRARPQTLNERLSSPPSQSPSRVIPSPTADGPGMPPP